MSELRERKKPASQPVPAHPSPHDAGLGKSEAPKKAVPIARSRPAPPRRKAPSILNAFFGLAVVGLVVLVAQSKLSAFGSRHPARYGICTFDDSVYLDAYTRTECVVIGADGAIESTGTRTETREKYGDLDTLGKLGRWNVNLPSSQAGKGLKIYNVPRGQAVYPGPTSFLSVRIVLMLPISECRSHRCTRSYYAIWPVPYTSLAARGNVNSGGRSADQELHR